MLSTSASLVKNIPPQMISYKEKIKNKKKWAKDTFDAFEALGRRQYLDNLRFAENYRMINGEFMGHHYFEEEGTKDFLTELTRDFELPSTLRHYDIIGKVVNNLTEKLLEFPDVFRVEELFEDDETNEFVRTQNRLLHESVKADINKEIKGQLIAEGFDPDKQNFATEDEAMQYYKELQQAAQALTPPQIQKYMTTTWQSQGEIWGTHQLSIDRQRHKLTELERKEFRDMVISDRCFRHYFLTGDGYMQETWNPINTFFHTSPDIDWVEEGDYVGRMVYMTKSDIINKFGWKMKSSDIKKLEDVDKEYGSKNDLSGYPYNIYAPFEDHKAYTQITKATGWDPMNGVPVMTDDRLLALTNKMPYNSGAGLYRVTELYWMSQRKIGMAVYLDEETGQPVKENVDENFVIPEGWKEKTGDFYTGDRINTVYWTYSNEMWKGIKIMFTLAEEESIYIDLEPAEFQFKGDYSPFGSKLPVCGRIFNDRNAQSMSLVDFMKPHQLGHNVCMNQLYQLLEKEIGLFVVWDSAFFNVMKDWGGEDSWDKIALVAKELGHVFGDTSPQNMKGANPGNQLPKVIDMELTSQMMSRAKLADFFENKAMAQLGISPQMMSEVSPQETATGVKTAVDKAQLNVQRYYTDFFEYKQRCLTMSLDIAQYTQATNRDITISYTQSDATRQWIRMTGLSLLLRNLHVYIVNSQELLRQMEMIRQWFLTNNTADVNSLDVIDVIKSNSPAQIKQALEESMRKKEAKEQQQIELQQQSIQQQGAIADKKEQGLTNRQQMGDQTKKEVAWINTFNKGTAGLTDSNQDNVPDALEYDKLSSQNQANSDKVDIAKDSNAIKREKLTKDTALKQRELDLKEKDIKEKAKASKDKVRIAKVNPG